MSNAHLTGIDACPNCGTPNCETYEGGVPAHAPSMPNPNKGTNPTFIPKTVLNTSYNAKKVSRWDKVKKWAKYYYEEDIKKEAKRKRKCRDHAKHDDDTIKDVYVTEFDACRMGNGKDEERKKRLNVDDRKDEVWKSCRDLAIDG